MNLKGFRVLRFFGLGWIVCGFILVQCNVHRHEWKEEIRPEELGAIFKSDPFVVVFYAYEPVKTNEQKRFNTNFGTAKEYLSDFLCTLIVVNCYNEEDDKPSCPEKTNSENVFFYRKGKLVVDVPVDSMFNEDAIIANILHLVLLQEVPILQNKMELNNLMNRNKGKKNIVFARLMAVGIPEDRVFIETAFAFSSTHQFAMTTLNDDLVGDSEWKDGEDKIWYLQCTMDAPCNVIPYRNAITLEGLVLFVKSIGSPNVIELSSDSVINFSNLGLTTVYISTNSQYYHETEALVSSLAQDFTGTIGFVHVNRDKIESGEIPIDLPACQTTCLFIQTKDGLEEFVGEMKYDTAWAYLTLYLNTKLKQAQDERDFEEEEEEEGHPSIYVTEQEVQDDPVQLAVFKLQQNRKLNTSGTQQLTDKSFPDFVAKDALTMVLFTVKWNPRCIAFLESFAKMGIILKQQFTHNPLARVECSDWPDVCELNNVTSYPIIKAYRNSLLVGDYLGPFQTTRVLQYYYLQSLNGPLNLKTEGDLALSLAGGYPDWALDFLKEVVVGVFSSEHSQEQRIFKEAATILKGSHLFAICDGECMKSGEEEFGQQAPFLVVVKWHDPHQPHVIFDGSYSISNIVKFTQDASRLVLPELTPQTLPNLIQKSHMLVILFFKDSDLSEEVEEKLGQVALMEQFTQVAMSWMDASSKNEAIMKNFLSDNEIASKVPNLVMINRKTKSVCHYPHDASFMVEEMTEWLHGAINEGKDCSVGFKHKEWKPLVPAYDFLSIIKEGQTEEESEHSGRMRTTTKQEVKLSDNKHQEEISSPTSARHPVHSEL